MENESYSSDSSNDDAKSWASGEGAPYTLKTTVLRKVAAEIHRASNSEIAAAAKFFSEGSIAGSDVVVKVREVGKLTFPVNQATVMKLIKVASPACYGLGEKTLMDTTVRDSHMIPADKLYVNIKNLPEILIKIKSSLGLDQNCALEASLFNMLVYQKDQFFDFHRDSEKMENMIATLVIALPSKHQGGELIIQHILNSHTFSSKIQKGDSNVKYVAFYADCLHRVEKVKSGHRIVLTYNIILQSGTKTTPLDTPRRLVAAVDNFFKNTKEHHIKYPMYEYNWEDKDFGERKLAFLLDYQYTKDGLKWDKLKGEDRMKAGLLIDVANKLNMKIFLAQADVLETWHGFSDNTNPKHCHDFGTFRTKLFSIQDLNDKEINLTDVKIRSGELCFHLENTGRLRPYKRNFEPTGNEGCTLERWYKRAAIVLWPADNHYKFLMLWNRQETFGNLCRLTDKPDKEEQVKMYIKLADKYLFLEMEKDLDSLIQMAIYIKDEIEAAKIACKLLQYILTPESMEHFNKLANAYGMDWFAKIIASLNVETTKVSKVVIDFALELCKLNSCQVVSAILHQQLFVGINQYRLRKESSAYFYCTVEQTDTYGDDIEAVLRGFASTHIDPLTDEVKNLLQTSAIKCQGLAKAILKCYHNSSLSKAVFNNLTAATVEILNQFVDAYDKQVKDKNDWSVQYSFSPCHRYSCLDCKALEVFLESPEKSSSNFSNSANHLVHRVSDKIIEFKKSTDPNDPTKEIGIIEKTPLLFTKIEKIKGDIEALIVALNTTGADLKRKRPSDANENPAKIQKI